MQSCSLPLRLLCFCCGSLWPHNLTGRQLRLYFNENAKLLVCLFTYLHPVCLADYCALSFVKKFCDTDLRFSRDWFSSPPNLGLENAGPPLSRPMGKVGGAQVSWGRVRRIE